MSKTPLILDIKGNSLDDGPGIRTVVFFKGCPLSCVWCHNPESKKLGSEISFDKNECIGCDTCISLCPEKALDRNHPFFIDRDSCNLCHACVDDCPSGALTIEGKKLSIEQIFEKVIKDKPFFNNSGGGVSLSGGEPTLYMSFVSALLKRLKTEGIHTLIETCGLFDLDNFTEKILPYTDSVYYDIKIYESDHHKNFCGVDNDLILRNFAALYSLSLKSNFELLPRTPLIPGITTTTENLTAIADFLKKVGVRKNCLLAFNPLWFDKNDKLGIHNTFKNNKDMSNWILQDHINEYTTIFKERGIQKI